MGLSADNYLDNILINGNATGINTTVPFNTVTTVNINSATYNYFQIGLNTITFVIRDAGGPNGLRVDSFTGTETIVETSTATVHVTVNSINDAPTANYDSVVAIEAGGVSNGTAGTNPTGNVLSNDTDPDAGDSRTVIGVVAGSTLVAAGSVGTGVTGNYGSITIGTDGSYTYTVDNNNSTVQALRNSSETIADVFAYTVEDNEGLTSSTQVTITIQGENDDPTDLTLTPAIAPLNLIEVRLRPDYGGDAVATTPPRYQIFADGNVVASGGRLGRGDLEHHFVNPVREQTKFRLGGLHE